MCHTQSKQTYVCIEVSACLRCETFLQCVLAMTRLHGWHAKTFPFLQCDRHRHTTPAILLNFRSILATVKQLPILNFYMLDNLFLVQTELQNLWLKTKHIKGCLLYTSPSPRDRTRSRMPSSA